jgi:hypothetical protein
VKIPEHKGGLAHEPWTRPSWIRMEHQNGTPAKPLIVCACGELRGIGLHHVHTDGRVTASFYHRFAGGANHPESGPGCGFHEFLELEGYDGPEFLPCPSAEARP